MTMQIKITNEDQTRVAAIQTFQNDSLQRVEQLLPGETKSGWLHSQQYVSVVECEKSDL